MDTEAMRADPWWRERAVLDALGLTFDGGRCKTSHLDIMGKALTAAHAAGHAAGNSQAAEIQMNAFEWMRAHDKLLGFIQARPEWLKELIENDPRGKMPSPADLPIAIAEARAEGVRENRREK